MPWTTVSPAPQASDTPDTTKGWKVVKPPSTTPPAKTGDWSPSSFMGSNVGPHQASQDTTNIGRVLDAQRFAVAKKLTGKNTTDEQMTTIRHAIPGMDWAYNATLPDTGVPLLDSIKHWSDHAAQGLIDAGIETAMDPLTYETLGFNKIASGLKYVAEAAIPAATREAAAGVASKVANAPGIRHLREAAQWGGDVATERGAPFVQGLRGTGNVASSSGSRVQQTLANRAQTILKTLQPVQQVKVGKLLNGELPTEMFDMKFDPENPLTLSPAEKRAYNQLRRLTDYDYKVRKDVAQTQAFKAYTGDLNDADKQTLFSALKSGKEIEVPKPEARIRQTNQAAQDIENRSRAVNATPGREFVGPTRPQTMLRRKAGFIGPTQPTDPIERITVNAGPLNKATEGIEEVALPPVKRFTFKPANQAAIDRATMLKDRYDKIAGVVDEKVPYRQNYMPASHQGEEEGREAFTVNPKNYFDPRNIQREEIHVTKPEQVTEGFGSMAANTGRAVKQRVLTQKLGDLLDDPKINKLFEETIEATGNKRSDIQKAKDAWLKLVGYPRAATVSITPRHGANIMDLAMNTIPPAQFPQFAKDAMELAAKLANPKITPQEYWNLTKEGRELGAISGNFAEKKAFFQNVPTTTLGDVPFGEHLPKGWQQKSIFGPLAGKSTGPIGMWTRTNNRLVWAIDEAAKITYAKILKEEGMKPLEAGGTASQRLVDYEHLSKLQKALKYVAPFGTFRGGIPGAVMGGIARNPARAAFLNRATGGTMYGGQPKQGQHGTELYNPTADVGRGLDNPFEFLRSTLGAPVQAGVTMLGEGITGHPGASLQTMGQEVQDLPKSLAHGQLPRPRKASKYADAVALHASRWMNYGNPIDWHWLLTAAASGVPEARDIVQQIGQGQFKAKPAAQFLGNEAAMQVLGIGNK